MALVLNGKKHLRKYGNDVTMEIYGTFEDINVASKIALEFSENNDIVKSEFWCNLILEDCYTGGSDVKSGLTYEEYYGEDRANEIKSKLSRVKSIDERMKISESLTGRVGPNKNRVFSDEWKENISKGQSIRTDDRSHSDETKRKIAEAVKGNPSKLKGRTRKQLVCPHCNKVGGDNGMLQWHFDKCKIKKLDV